MGEETPIRTSHSGGKTIQIFSGTPPPSRELIMDMDPGVLQGKERLKGHLCLVEQGREIWEVKSRYPRELSGGEERRGCRVIS